MNPSNIHVRRRSGRRANVVHHQPGRSARKLLTLAVTATVVAVVGASALVAPPQAQAATLTGVRIETASSTAFIATVTSQGPGWSYRIYASTVRTQVYYPVLAKAPYRSSASTTGRIGIFRIPYTTKPVWYRIQAVKGKSHRTSDIFSVGLKPATPTGLTASAPHGAVSLSWGGGASSGAQVQQATNAAFTTGVRTYTITGTGRQLTPVSLTTGTSYFFRVRARNLSTASSFTAPVEATPSARGQDIRVMTYNILTLSSDGTKAAGGTISPWSQRRLTAASYIKKVMPDVIGIQEGATFTGAVRGPRQVDDLVRALGDTYGLARTEIPPNEPGYYRVGNYLIYKKAAYAPVGNGGYWDIGRMPEGGSRYAVYQVLRNRTTGAQVLAVTTHLYTPNTAAGDRLRQQETESMIAQAQAYASSHGGLPIVYSGDFNSHDLHGLDGPAVAMNKAKVADGFWVSQVFGNKQFNSANQYYRTPPASSDNIDHIYASPGVGVRAWSQVLTLSGGKFVGVIPSDHNPVVADLTYPY